MLRMWFFAVVIVFLTSMLFAGDAVDVAFLSTYARAEAIGSAVVAQSLGLGATYINPAQIVVSRNAEMVSSTGKMFDDYTRLSLGFSKKLNEQLTIGCMYTGMEMNGIPRVEKTGDRPDVLYETADKRMVFMGIAGYQLWEQLVLGATLKYYQQEIFEERATALSLDIGTRYKILKTLFFGATIRNLTQPAVAWSTGHSDTLSREYVYGFSWETRLWLWRTIWNADTVHSPVLRPYTNLGLEFWLADELLALRVGRNNGVFNAGAGLTIYNCTVDYVYSDHDDLGVSHRVSLGAFW